MRTKAAVITFALTASASAVAADTSITAYGLVDTFFQYVNTGAGYTGAISSSGQFASRFGLRGSEDIGSGYKVNFNLENGFNSDSGTFASPGVMFNRQSWVGTSGAFGDARIGRQNSLLFINMGVLDAFGGSTQASGINNFAAFFPRTSDTFMYFSPTFAGLQLAGGVGLGAAGGLRQPGSSYQAALTYANGPVAAFIGTQGVKAAQSVTDRTTFAGASYAISRITVYGGFAAVKWDDLKLDNRIYSLSAKYDFSFPLSVSLGYAHLQDRTGNGDHARQFSVMASYALSKRTNFYGALSYLDNRGNATYTLAGAANPGIPVAYPGAPARGLQAGIVHRF